MSSRVENLEKTLMDLIKPKESRSGTASEGHLTVDVYHNNREIVVQSAIGGVKGENIDLGITKDTVTIKGFREKTDQTNPGDYLHQELHWGTFSRSVILPADIDVDRAKASVKNGLLTIRLPKLSQET